MYLCASISYQDGLEDMKYFHSYVCVCIMYIWIQTDDAYTSTGLRHSVAPLIRYLSYVSICTCVYPYHIEIGLNIWSVSIHTNVYPSSVWITTGSDSDGWCIHLLAGSPLMMCISNKTNGSTGLYTGQMPHATYNTLWTNGSTALYTGQMHHATYNTLRTNGSTGLYKGQTH